MLSALSFDLEGSFAAFRDPSVTTNQTVYLIPSKTQIIGLLGAILGIERGHSLGPIYSKDFLNFLKVTEIGIQFEGDGEKISFFTNHHSFKKDKKESKIKPVKSEVLINAKYRIYVITNESNYLSLKSAISENKFKYTPFLGHAYCPAIIKNLKTHDAEEIDFSNISISTSSVVLDETIETQTVSSSSLNDLEIEDVEKGFTRITVERHLHNFLQDGVLRKLVLRHWVPIQGTRISFKYVPNPELNFVKFFKLDSKEIVCFY